MMATIIPLRPHSSLFPFLPWPTVVDWGYRAAHLEARDPARNGAIRDLEQINALYFRCDHERPCLTRIVHLSSTFASVCEASIEAQITCSVKSVPDGKRFFQASRGRVSPFSEKFHPSVQNWSAL